LQPDNIEAWYNRAVALKKIGRFAEAIASYDQIIALQPDDPNLHYQKACVYALEKQVLNIVKDLKKQPGSPSNQHPPSDRKSVQGDRT